MPSMLVREYVQACAQCGALTPHSRRMIAWPWSVACIGVAGAAWISLQGLWGWFLAAVLAWCAAYVVLRDRERCWRIRCERCRWKRIVAIKETKPKLDGRTEIFLP